MKYWGILLGTLFCVSMFFIFDFDEKVEKGQEEVRAVYFSYIEFANYITNKSEKTQKANIKKVLDNLQKEKFNRIIVHVRAFADAFYESEYYPVSKYIFNDKDEVPSYDILKYFISEAHKRDIKFDAWINPYRISNLQDEKTLSQNSLYYKFSDSSVTEKGIYLNPANEKVRDYIVNGVVELVKKYDVDGIHFDDYFYPDDKIDLKNYEEYVANGGDKSINDYRLDNVKKLIKSVYSSIKKTKKDVLFGIAPEGNIDNCYSSFLDVKEILSSSGYVDYIMPQIYFGFNNKTRPYEETLKQWHDLIKVDSIEFIPALAIYKSGKTDMYALDGKSEWIKNSDIIKREIELARTTDKYTGFSLFSYNYLFNSNYQNKNTIEELSNVRKILE